MPTIQPTQLFTELHGEENAGFFALHAPVQRSPEGIPYLARPGVALLARPQINTGMLAGFLDGFNDSLKFGAYLDDPTELPAGAQLCKIAGQTCYMSFGPGRTKNEQAERYFNNLKSSKHGSVFEHANYSFHLYGISRSVTHELIRHRAGFSYSQVSQRYVSGRTLRFVERPEYSQDPRLHTRFIERIERAAGEYAELTNQLLEKQQSGDPLLTAEARTDLRKKVQQCARSVLPNETEAPIVVTGNARAWRHFIEMRSSPHAEIEIRELAIRIYLCLALADPLLFGDYALEGLPDGTHTTRSEYEKV